MPKPKKIAWYTDSMGLSQALSSGLEFAFVSKNYEQCCPFVLCKDYLQDAIYNHLHKAKKSIYGFKYDPDKHFPLHLEQCRLVLANSSDSKFRDKVPVCLDFINQIETKLKIAKTKARECADPPKKYLRGGVFLFEGSRRWLISPPMVSLYTLLLRVGFCHVEGDSFEQTIKDILNKKRSAYQGEDYNRLRNSQKGLERILKTGDRKIFPRDMKRNYPKGISINTLHNDLGICAFSCGDTKGQFPNWHKED